MEPVLTVKGLLLDMDGLLLDTERVAERSWLDAEEETGYRMPAHFYHTLIGQSMRACRQRLEEVMDPACDCDAFIESAKRHYYAALAHGDVPVKPGAADFLRYLADHNVPRCLATSTHGELCVHKLESAGLIEWLPLRVCGDDVQHSKPAPDIYLAAARRLGFPPADLLVFEDSENGLRAGLAAGCPVVHVPDMALVNLDVQARAVRVYRDLPAVLDAFGRGEIRIA